MARRIRRIKRVSHSARVPNAGPVRSEARLPEASARSATRVLIAAPGPIRTVLASRISSSEEVRLAGVAENEATAVEKVLTEDADVAAIYVHLGGVLNGLEIARNVNRAHPESGILIMVNELAGVDVRRHSRLFGTAWSYSMWENLQAGTRFIELVQSVARGIHWIDPELRRVMEAIWRIAEEGRDMEAAKVARKMTFNSPPPDVMEAGESRPGGMQTVRTGNSGVGSTGFGVGMPSQTDAAAESAKVEDDDEDLPQGPGNIQTIKTGKGGTGSDGFGVTRAS